jgi:hypothetical protein
VADERKRRKRTKAPAKTTGKASTKPGKAGKTGRVTEKASARYTPPIPPSYQQPSKFITILTFALFGIGVIIILLNYLPGAPLIPGDTTNRNLLIELGFVVLGFGTSTRLR